MPDLRLEASSRPRDEYIYNLWRIQVDLHPDGYWTWMVEQEKNNGVWFHHLGRTRILSIQLKIDVSLAGIAMANLT